MVHVSPKGRRNENQHSFPFVSSTCTALLGVWVAVKRERDTRCLRDAQPSEGGRVKVVMWTAGSHALNDVDRAVIRLDRPKSALAPPSTRPFR